MISGGCLCGKVRYQSDAEPITARLCWCRFCQYIAAGNAAVSVCFPAYSMTITGDMRDYESVAESGHRMHRRFCPNCGVHLFSEAESRRHLIFVRAGTLVDPGIVRPAATIWTAKAPAWACIDASLPSFERQPPPVA
ncbi:GFA family protein [Mesorhizobium sp. ZMM04-5]|uniref:GFA family protein n=1 Tax=Mesorhizobium marinum TaxID=3228790 RepID=A0ABV3QW52_9HYPH